MYRVATQYVHAVRRQTQSAFSLNARALRGRAAAGDICVADQFGETFKKKKKKKEFAVLLLLAVPTLAADWIAAAL